MKVFWWNLDADSKVVTNRIKINSILNYCNHFPAHFSKWSLEDFSLSTERHTKSSMIVFLVPGKLANAEMRKKFAILCFNLFQIYFNFIYRIFIRVLCLLCPALPAPNSIFELLLYFHLRVYFAVYSFGFQQFSENVLKKNPSNQYSISK